MENQPDSTSGNAGQNDVLFLDANGQTLYDLVYNQGQPLATIALPVGVFGVKDIVLPSGTFYDNINVTTVPVPSAFLLFGSALAGFVGLRRRNA